MEKGRAPDLQHGIRNVDLIEKSTCLTLKLSTKAAVDRERRWELKSSIL